MFEDLDIQIYYFSLFLSSALGLPRDWWEGRGACFALFYFSYIGIDLDTGLQVGGPCLFTEKLSTLDDSDGTWSPQD